MNNDKILDRVTVTCPICENIHEVKKRERETQALMKGEVVDYKEVYYLCTNTDADDNEYVSAEMLNVNLERIRNARFCVE